MAFHKNYHKGDAYQHTAARENDISMALNRLSGFQLPGQAASPSGLVRVACYNSSSEKIVAGSAVMFSKSKPLCGDAVPIEIYSDSDKPFAVLENTLESNKIGNAIVAGATAVNASGAALDFVVPDISSPGTFKYFPVGTARVIFSSSEKAVILLCSSAPAYDGSFKVELASSGKLSISSGYLNRNGEFMNIAAATGITPQAGILCLCSTIEEGKWTKPEFRIAQPAVDAYPIAEISVEEVKGNTSVVIRQFSVSVAIIFMTKRCPLTKEQHHA